MDSITQITLGAAVGEAVLGRKIGNRAMLWGAVAGTIPDLDVFANLVLPEIDALAFHRGFSHSILFAILGAIVFGWLIDKFYKFKYRRTTGFLAWLIFILLVIFVINISASRSGVNVSSLLISFIVLIGVVIFKNRKYFIHPRPAPGVSALEWMYLIFWSLFTHPLLDSCTVYGTQLFQPFSDYRVAWNNIAVADPFYSVPFLLLVFLASLFHKSHRWRRFLNYAALAISSLYLIWTLSNKYQANQVMEKTLATENISYSRYMSGPTILNNWLWYAVAETDSLMHFGLYSFSDKEASFKLKSMAKNHHWLDARTDDKTINTLKWFTKGYFSVIRRSDGELQINDMRYGTFGENEGGEEDFIFRFQVKKNELGYFELQKAVGGPPEDQNQSKAFKELVARIKGI